jgi:hypothetical protein
MWEQKTRLGGRRVLWAAVAAILLHPAFEARAATALPAPRMTYLDNGEVRIGMDLALGGAVTFLSGKDHPGNLINSADLGRQIQMSHYSGPWPYEVGDKKPHPAWVGLGWNPIQSGDCHLNPSEVVEHRNDGQELYIRCLPMQWPLDHVRGDCVFETWTTLEGPLIHMRFRCTNRRSDKTQYRPCPQELPAVYTISKLGRLMAYTGDRPFTGAPLTHVTNDWRKPWPWTRFLATEGWAALVDDSGFGLGVFKADGLEFHGGLHGDARSDDPKHGSTAYVAPIHREHFDHNLVYEHRTEFLVGRLEEIRRRFNAMADRRPPLWRFQHDRQHWVVHGASDAGFPLSGAWVLRIGERVARLESGGHCWRAEDAPSIKLRIASTGGPTTARVFWKRLGDNGFDREWSVPLELAGDGKVRTQVLALGDSPGYRGLITGLAIESGPPSRGGQTLRLHSIELGPANSGK